MNDNIVGVSDTEDDGKVFCVLLKEVEHKA